jgi:hypothetical protein
VGKYNAYLQVFSRVLSTQEMDRALSLPGSVRPGLVLFPFMLDTAHTFDLSGNGFHPTTAFPPANREGPPARTVWMASDDDETSLLLVAGAAEITEAGDTLAASAGVAVESYRKLPIPLQVQALSP